MRYVTLLAALLVFSAAMATLKAAQLGLRNGLIFNDVTLQDGATDGDEGYFKIGNDLVILARPGSYEYELLAPLKGQKVYFELRPQ